MLLSILMCIHLMAVLFWIGGAVAAAGLLAARAAGSGSVPEAFEKLEARFLYRGSHAGMAGALLSGIAMTLLNPDYFLGEGWFHAKLLLVAVLVALSVRLGKARKALLASPGSIAASRVEAWALWMLGAAALIILLVFTRLF